MKRIANWLNDLGLKEYIQIFEDNEIGMADLPGLSKSDLAEMGIVKIGPRNRILNAIKALGQEIAHGTFYKYEQFPSVLAIPLNEYAHEQNPVLKLWHACDAVELLLRLVVMLGASELKAKGPLPVKLVKELSHRIEEPTLGKWKGMASAVVAALPDDSLFPELKSLLSEGLLSLLDGSGEAQKKDPQESFVALRNQLAHGGGVTWAVAANLLEQWSPRIDGLIDSLEWLKSLHFVACSKEGFIELSGAMSSYPKFVPAGPSIKDALANVFWPQCSVAVVRGADVLSLWPLTLFGLPRSLNADDPEPGSPVTQVYVRRGDVRLQYTPIGSEEVCLSESGEDALEAFEQFFSLKESQWKTYEVRGFEKEIKRDASKLIGRKKEVEKIQRAVREKKYHLLWLTGPPGMGKSYLMARVASELLLDPPENAQVFVYRFKAGDDRCSRDRFIHFALERILGKAKGEFLKGHRKLHPFEQLQEAIEMNSKRFRMIYILDGLDEIAEIDPEFAMEVVRLCSQRSIWLCAGRPEHGLPEIFAEAGAHILFENGLPPMSDADVRSMLLEKIGPIRKRLILQDRESNSGQIENPFIKQVLKNSKGFPIYVAYVIGDILSNRYRYFDGKEKLPPSLEKYHEELLKRCEVGILHQVVSPLVATIAVSMEPLTIEALGEILHHNNSIPDDEDRRAIVSRAISCIASMLRRTSTPDGESGYTLFHHSLRQHMYGSDETRGILVTAEKNLAVMVSRISECRSARSYLLRWGISHLLKAQPQSWPRTLKMIFQDQALIREKLACQSLENFFLDYVRAFGSKVFEPTDKVLGIVAELALEKITNGEWDLEQLHSLLVHRKDQAFYREFLQFITEQRFPENGKRQLIVAGFKARLANLLRREGVDRLAEAELLLRECLDELETKDSAVSLLEVARLQYDLAYIIGFLRGRVDESLPWFDKSIQSSKAGGNKVGVCISTIARAQTMFYYGKLAADSFYAIVEKSKPVFLAAAEQGDENGKRWIMNVHAHLFHASFINNNPVTARKYYELLEDDPWFERFECKDSMLPYRARMAMLDKQYERAVGHFEEYFRNAPRLDQVIISSIYLDYGAALKRVGRINDAIYNWGLGLKAHDDFGNRPWKEQIRKKMKALA
ncbi:MAG: NACHT domain-containing protein [Methanobacteriota archaeon]|nr:MAG: NACHT domain-containing protein [Euryarchaeota archaeon]